uniref:phage major capsid protein n=1 Tax=Altererythrobacter segetis TaxID=1104773 RepID=UPI001408F2F9|nr:phage major capsid protein [Altererythrobacter segetis]
MTRQVALRETRLDATKAAITFAVCGTGDLHARAWAVERWGEAGAPREITKAADAVTVSDIDSSTSTGLLDRELFRAVRERALLFRMRGIRRTGFRVRSTTISNSTATWVAEAKPIPVLKPAISNVGLVPAKLAAMSVWTKEALEASPMIEQLVFDDLTRAFADALDLAMFDPANDGSAIAPAALTNGATEVAATSDIDDDLAEVFAAFTGDLATAVFVTTPQIGAGLARDFNGDVGARGGEIAGVPTLTSSAAPDGQLTLVDPATILAAWDEEVMLATSEAGTVEMVTSGFTQDQPTGAALVSLWENNLRSIRAIGRVAWEAAGPAAAVSITGLFPSAT